MKLPESFVKRGLELAAGSLLFGKPFAEMTRDELIAAAAQGWNDARLQQDKSFTELQVRAEARTRSGVRL